MNVYGCLHAHALSPAAAPYRSTDGRDGVVDQNPELPSAPVVGAISAAPAEDLPHGSRPGGPFHSSRRRTSEHGQQVDGLPAEVASVDFRNGAAFRDPVGSFTQRLRDGPSRIFERCGPR